MEKFGVSVLATIQKELEKKARLGVWDASDPIIQNVVGVQREHRASYLSGLRDIFLKALVLGTDEEVALRIEAVLKQLVGYWQDAKEYIDCNPDGIDVPGDVWSLMKTYYQEANNYIAVTYYQHLFHHTDLFFDLEKNIPGLQIDNIYHLLEANGVATKERIKELERKAKKSVADKKMLGSGVMPDFPKISGSKDNWTSLAFLEAHIDGVIQYISQGEYDGYIDWEDMDGKNKADFIDEIIALSKKKESTYYSSILYVLDTLSRLYNRIRAIQHSVDEKSAEGTLALQCEQLLTSYFGAVFMQNQQLDPKFCVHHLLQDIGTSLDVNWPYFMNQVASFNGISQPLNMRYQANQCEKCQERGCKARISDVLGVLDYVGDKCDSIILKKHEQPADNEPAEKKPKLKKSVRHLDIPRAGIKVIDAFSDYFDDPNLVSYYRFDLTDQFRDLCRQKAEDKKLSQEEKSIWGRRIVNTLNDAFRVAMREGKVRLAELTVWQMEILESEFMQMADPICVKKLGFETGNTDVLESKIIIPAETAEKSAEMKDFRGVQIIQELGKNVEFYEKRLCESCNVLNCPYDYFMRKYQEDGVGVPGKYDFTPSAQVNQFSSTEKNNSATASAESGSVSFGDIKELPAEFQSAEAIVIWEKAYKAGLIDEHFRFKGKQQERALFAGNLSVALFGKIDWVSIRKWDDYRFFPQKYNIMSDKSREELSKRGKVIYDLFA